MDSSSTTMNKPKQSISLDQNQLKQIGDDLCDNIEELLDYFDIEYRQTDKMIIGCCPIHGGDNRTALNIYPYGDNYRGNWKCRTHQCEETFMSSIIGFVRGLLSSHENNWAQPGDDMVSFVYTLDFISKFLDKDLTKISKKNNTQDKTNFIKNVNIITRKTETIKQDITRDIVRKSLQIPAKYYLDRGYSREILDKYDVGLCLTKNKPMYQRVVVPIYDINYEFMIGCTGRSIFDKCTNCGSHHDQSYKCPNEYSWLYSKWKHNKGFKAEDTLYNYWFAKDHIKKYGTAILVEGPGNVWRLEENKIHNSVAIFGSNISNKQKMLLDTSGAMNIVVLTDNDAAGEKAKEQIKNKFGQTYRIFCPKISKNDVGDMSNQEIKEQIIDYLESKNI